ncbi:MAG TPA: DegT/DnrJ/EryC1/StrS family aminotransferase [Geobacteraceae bacterium]|nr:DegT/DnrJ/EryC1/StrS family aminotransferase [Geobacteraceae bacterium]
MQNIPFLDLKAQYETIREEIAAAVQGVLDSTAFVGGPFVQEFEERFAAFCGCDHAVGVSSGTSALWMTMLSLGIGPGDEVITVPNTFIATAEAISLCGAKPVFVDVDESTYTMDPEHLAKVITPRTRAIIPVHLFGQPADMDPILDIAGKSGIPVIEDACQAHGALYRSKPAGSMGIAGCFSFYPGKNLGAYGEAGAVVTDNRDLADKIRRLRDHGQTRKYHHAMIGWNGRMDGIQGAILGVKLKYLAEWNELRRNIAALYDSLLQGVDGIVPPCEMEYARHVYHIYALRAENRDELMGRLAEKGVTCLVHYPVPVHLQDAYRHFGLCRGSFPVAERCAGQFISLPMFPELKRAQVERIVREIRSFFGTPSGVNPGE